MGIPDAVIEHGEQIELHNECGFGPEGIQQAVLSMLETVSLPAGNRGITYPWLNFFFKNKEAGLLLCLSMDL